MATSEPTDYGRFGQDKTKKPPASELQPQAQPIQAAERSITPPVNAEAKLEDERDRAWRQSSSGLD
jgi:hypothetical protein